MSCSNLGTSYVGYLLYEWSAIELRIWNHQLLGRPGKTWETNLHLQWHNLKDLSKSFENQKVLRVLGCHDVIPLSRMNLNKAAQYIQLYTYTNCVLFLAKKNPGNAVAPELYKQVTYWLPQHVQFYDVLYLRYTAALACSGCNAGAVFTKRPSRKVSSCAGSRSFLTKFCQVVQTQSPNLQNTICSFVEGYCIKTLPFEWNFG